MEMTVREIVAVCGGKLLCGDPDTVVTDNREVAHGSLFVPLKGRKTDAHTFLHAAFASGAAAALTQEHTRMEAEEAWIAVGSTQLALALSARYNVMKTRGNHNSQIGLPLMMFEFSREHEAAVVEMGMSDFGEMARLARVAEPKYAVMTNIGIAHIGQLKTRENILREKLRITDRFTQDSVLLLNGDDPMLAGLRGKTTYETVFYGTAPWCDFRAEGITVQKETTTFRCIAPRRESVDVTLPVLGMHHVLDALAGLAVAERLGVTLDRAATALGDYRPLAMRQQVYHVNEITRSVRSGIDCRVFDNNHQTVAELKSFLSPGDAVLVKGSRGMHTDEIVRALL